MKKLIFIILLFPLIAFADNYEIHDQGVLIPDDYFIHFGSDADFKLGYDEATDNVLELSDGTNTFVSIADNGATSTITVTGVVVVSGNISGATYGSDSSVTDAELLYINTLTSNAQAQIDAKGPAITGGATTIATDDLTASRALVSNGSGKVAVSDVTSTEVDYLDGVTSAIQPQINAKAPSNSPTLVTPTLGVATATSLAASGDVTGATSVTLDTAATVVLTAANCLGAARFNNDADVIDYTLPGAAAGLTVVFYDIAGGVITVDPTDGTDTIYLNGTSVGAGDAIDSPGAVGNFIALMALDDTRWVTIGRSGVWVDGGAD